MSASTPAGPNKAEPRRPSDVDPVHPGLPTPGRWDDGTHALTEANEVLRDVRAELALLIERFNQ